MPHRHAEGEPDQWALSFFQSMLSNDLTSADFEQAVDACWRTGTFIFRAPRTAEWLLDIACAADKNDAGYASEAPHLGFRSQWLVGVPGQPGAIHIQAPGELADHGMLHGLNRPPHQHDSGRIAVVTRGTAIFHVLRHDYTDQPGVIDCPVAAGDMIFWPAWTPHTFNAQQGFCLVSAMANYVSPAEDGFVFPVGHDLEALPRRVYADPPRR